MDGLLKDKLEIRNPRMTQVASAAFIALVTFIVYLPLLQAGYIWDDDTTLTENPLIRSLSGLRDIWFSTKPYDYFPLTFTSFWLEWRLWGMHATGYHVVNVLLHTLGAILLWRVLLRLIPQCGTGAWLAAMVFAVHPVCVASVAWVAERKNTLSLVFFLLSLLWYLRSESVASGEWRATEKSHQVTLPITCHTSRYYWLSLLAFLLALLSKTSVVTMPFVLWLCVWWRRTQDTKGVLTPTHPSSRSAAHLLADLRRLAPFFALALVFGLATVWFQSRATGVNSHTDSLGVRLLGGSWAVWFYLGKALWPVKLSMIYPGWQIHPVSVTAYVPALLWWGAIILCWRFRRGWGAAALFGFGYFFVMLSPVLGFFDMYFFVYARVADHLQYLALIGIIALVVGGVSARFQSSGLPFRLSAGAAVAVLSVLTWQQVRVYTNQETLWRDTLAKNPQAWAAYNNLGLSVTNLEEKAGCYRTALRLKPDFVQAHNNLGDVLNWQGKRAEAIAHFEEAIRLQPDFAVTHNNLSVVLFSQGKHEEAITRVKEALRLQPDYALAHNNLGGFLYRQRRYEEAIAHFKETLRLQPDNAAGHNNLGGALLDQGKIDEALVHLKQAVQINPNHPGALINLGLALTRQGRLPEAVRHFEALLRLNPTNPEAHNNLAVAFALQGKFEFAVAHFKLALENGAEPAIAHDNIGMVCLAQSKVETAIEHYREAIRLRPNEPEALNHLARVLASHSEAQYRNGAEAVQLAERAVALMKQKDASKLDTLAAAYAEAGRFAEAVKTASQASDLAKATRQKELAAQIESRLKLYQAQQPWREPGGNR